MKYLQSFLCLLFAQFNFSCSSNSQSTYESKYGEQEVKSLSKVEKAWLARHKYDKERRLLIPQIGGARWGAIQEYKEDGTLVYRDWWVRDVKIEDLESAPSTKVENLIDDSMNESNDIFRTSLDAKVVNDEDAPSEEVTPTVEEPITDDPFGIDPFGVPATPSEQPAEEDPFAPLPTPEEGMPVPESGDTPEASPFAPLVFP